MKYFTITINDKEYNLRMKSADIAEIEKKYNMPMQEFVTKASFENCATLLRYLRKSSENNYSITEAHNFVDELIDDGYSLETIYTEIIFPACVESGVLTKDDLNKIMEAITEQHNKKVEDLQNK